MSCCQHRGSPLAYLSGLVLVVTILSGCGLTYSNNPENIPADEIAAEIVSRRSGFLGVDKNCAGEIIAYCCVTACATLESANQFAKDFKQALAERVPSTEKRHNIESHLQIVNDYAEVCTINQKIKFAIVDTSVGPAGQEKRSVGLSSTDLHGTGSAGARGQLRDLIAQFLASEGGNPNLVFRITIPACPPGSTSSPSSPSGSSQGGGASNSDERNSSEECQAVRCTLPPAEEWEVTFNWDGIL